MQSARRAARELALKALFQLDVGKQPLEEVVQGALEQVARTVSHPVSQLVHEMQAEFNTHFEQCRAAMSTQSVRYSRNVIKSLLSEMTALVDSAAGKAAEMIALPAERSVSAALQSLERDVAASVDQMSRTRTRGSLQPELVATLVELATDRARQVPSTFSRAAPPAHASATLFHALVSGVLEKRAEIDQRVGALSEGWALDRQPAVDRNILRIAAYEILFVDNIPAGASINEAVELAKKYSTNESGRFVNGVLGALVNASNEEVVAEDTAGEMLEEPEQAV